MKEENTITKVIMALIMAFGLLCEIASFLLPADQGLQLAVIGIFFLLLGKMK